MEPNSPPLTRQKVPKAAAQGQAGGRACSPTRRGTGPPRHGAQRSGELREGEPGGRSKALAEAEKKRRKDEEVKGWREKDQEELRSEGGERGRGRGGGKREGGRE